jgi:hypothetical protein
LGQSYAEGSSWYAYEAQDSCYVGGLHTTPVEHDDGQDSDMDPFHAPYYTFDMKFGCQNRITGLFKTQLADGIMGMDKAAPSFWKQMYDHKKIDKQAFALCFSRPSHVAREGTVAGAMSLGGSDTRLHKSPMVFTEDGASSGFYKVRIRKAYLRDGNSEDSANNPLGAGITLLGATETELNTGNVIVDSGTTDTYFHKNFGKYFTDVFQQKTGKRYDNKLKKMTKEEVDSYPTILFQLYGHVDRNSAVAELNKDVNVAGLAGDMDPEHPYDVILAIPPSHYFEYDEDEDMYAARFYASESRGSVLGANSMMGHDVLFDIDNGLLGWAESDCNYTDMVAKYFEGTVVFSPNDPAVVPTPRESSEDDANEEPRFEPEDKQEVEEVTKAQNEYCTGLHCQIAFAVALVSSIVLIGLQLARSSSSSPGGQHELSELEMQTPPSVVAKGSSSYRDDGSGHGGEFS